MKWKMMIVALSCLSVSAWAQFPVQVNRTQDETITSIRKDLEGRVCFSSLRGLYRYDGTEITELVGNLNVLDFILSDDGSFWLATPAFLGHVTPGGPVSMYHMQLYGNNKKLCDLGASFVMTNDNGIYLMDAAGEIQASYAHSFSGNIALLSCGDGQVLLAAKEEIILFDSHLNPVRSQRLPGGTEVNALSLGEDGKVLMGTNRGLMEYSLVEGFVRPVPSLQGVNVTSLARAPGGPVFLITLSDGLFRLTEQGNTEHICPLDGILLDRIQTFALDGNHLWLSSPQRGLFQLVIPRQLPSSALNALVTYAEGKRIMGMEEDSDGKIWLLESGNLSVFDKESGRILRIQPPAGLEGEDIRAFTIDSEDRVWIATNDFLVRTEIRGTTLVENVRGRFYQNGVYRIVEDADGIIHFASYSLLYTYSDKSSFSVMESPAAVPVSADKKRLFYLESREGTVSFRKEGAQIRDLPVLPDDETVVDAVLSEEGSVWCLSNNGTLLRIDDGGSVERFSLPVFPAILYPTYYRTPVYSLEEDSRGKLWLGSTYGLVKVDPSANGRFNLYNTASKYDYYTASLEDSEGYLYFAYSNGLTIFSPDTEDVLNNYSEIPFSIEQILVNDIPFTGDFSRQAVFNADENSFAFKCVDINYDNSRIRYQYMLKGFDDGWHSLNQRYVSFPNLAPGDYTFLLRVEGQSDDREVSFSFKIKQVFWLSLWAIGIYSILTILLLFGFRRWANRRKEQAALEERRKLQQEIDQVKISLFTNLSHEIRTPLSLILAPLGDLEKSVDLTRQDAGKVALMSRSARDLLDLVNHILDNDLSGSKPTVLRRNGLLPVLENSVSLFQPLALQNGQQITLCSDPLVFDFDAEKLSRIMSNLLSNAIKYADKPGVVTVKAALLSDNQVSEIYGKSVHGEGVEVQVMDQGPGIPEPEREAVFERHVRKAGGVQGFGIGLNYVRELVNAHGGMIRIESGSDGEGTLVRFVLPVGKNGCEIQSGDSPESSSVLENAPDGVPDREELRGCSVFIVDDNRDMRDYLQSLFRGAESVKTAADATQALRLLKEEYVDVVISDVMMDGMDGFQLCEAIKTDEETCSVSVILLTARSDTPSQIHGLDIGADAYVVKPFVSDYLLAVVGSVLRKRELRQKAVLREVSGSLSEQTAMEASINPLDKAFLDKLYAFLDERLREEKINVNLLIQDMGLSRTAFYMKLKSLTGMSPIQYINEYRMNKARALLESRQYSIKEIAYRVGYQTRQSFTARFKSTFGYAPTEYWEKNHPEENGH